MISLARYAVAYTPSRAADSRNTRVRLTAAKGRLEKRMGHGRDVLLP